MSDQGSILISSLQGASNSWQGFNWESKSKQWIATTTQQKDSREQSLAARKQLAETTKQFKRSVKNLEQAGSSLGSSNTQENASVTVKAIESLQKSCRQTVKAYQGEIFIIFFIVFSFPNFQPCQSYI